MAFIEPMHRNKPNITYLLTGWCQAIIWTNAGILLIGPLGINFSEIFIENQYIFIEGNAFENAVCEMAAILSQRQCVKS